MHLLRLMLLISCCVFANQLFCMDEDGSERPLKKLTLSPTDTEQNKDDLKKCNECSATNKDKDKDNKLKRCVKCKITYYCNDTCQINNWRKHKRFCKSPSSENRASKPDNGYAICWVPNNLSELLL